MGLQHYTQDMNKIPLKYNINVLFYTKYIHPTLICRGTHACTHTRTHGRTDRRKIFTQYSGISSCSEGSTNTSPTSPTVRVGQAMPAEHLSTLLAIATQPVTPAPLAKLTLVLAHPAKQPVILAPPVRQPVKLAPSARQPVIPTPQAGLPVALAHPPGYPVAQ